MNEPRRRKVNLQTAISMTSMLLVVAILAFVAVGLGTRLSTIMQESAMERTLQTVNQGNTSLGIYFSGMMEAMSFFQSMVQSAPEVKNQSLSAQMSLLKGSRKDITNLAVFSRDGHLLNAAGARLSSMAPPARDAEWFERALSARPSTISFSSPYLQSIFASQYTWVSTVSTQVSYRMDGEVHTGVLLMDVNFRSIDSVCENVRLGESGYVYMIDPNYELVYHPQQQLIASGLRTENLNEVERHVFGRFFDRLDGRERYVIVQTINNTRWRLVGVAYMDEMMSVRPEMFRLMATLSISGLLLAAAFAVLLARWIARPIIRLERVMQGVEGGEMEVSIRPTSFSEINSLSNAFLHMIRRIKELMSQIVVEQEAKRLHELNALQAQINPHFLYNTLDSIVWMLEVNQNPEAIRMVTALARLFRISISRGRNLITVAEELEHVCNYLIIQSMRFKDRFDYNVEADDSVLSLLTVKLILQPMVENAIVHGLAQFAVDKGMIGVFAYIEDGMLVLRVEDNGSGMTEEQIGDITRRSPGKSGIGVRNVDERIQLTFGKQYGISISSELDEGTVVTIRLPILTKEEDVP